MTVEQGVAEAQVKIRIPRPEWILALLQGGIFVALGTFVTTPIDEFDMPRVFQIFGCVVVAQSFWLRTYGIHLTPTFANLRGLRRRGIPWSEVQAVLRDEKVGQWTVRLILENGRPVRLRAPSTFLGWGRAQYERDFDRIGQWWLAHRGESWRPVRPEAPRLPAQG